MRIVRTGCAVFPLPLKIGSFLAVSDSPLELNFDRLRDTLFAYPRDGGTVFDRNKPDDVEKMEKILRGLRRIVQSRDALTAGSPRVLVTDDNMGTEFEREFESFH